MRKSFYSFFCLSLLMFGFNNCSPSHVRTGGESSTSSLQIDTTSDRAVAAKAILTTNCSGCHSASLASGGVSNISDLAGLVAQAVVVPASPSTSRLIAAVQSGAMPPTGRLSSSDVEALSLWITNVYLVPPPSVTPPTTTPVDSATFAQISASILVPHCVTCHGSTVASGGYRFDSYANVMMAVQAGNLASSPLYDAVARGAMPKGGPFLSPADLQSIAQWINDGAANN